MITQEPIGKIPARAFQQANKIVHSKLEVLWLKLRVFLQVFLATYEQTGNARAAVNMIRQTKNDYEKVFGEPLMTKVARVNGRYFWRLSAPGFPSPASYRMYANEITHHLPGQPTTGLRSLLFAITKKCPLNCEHCFEWGNLNQPEELSSEDLKNIVRKYQRFGTTQIMFTGGEPLLRINDICAILKDSLPGTDFWIISSGLGLNAARAQRLKEAGLTGVMISLDHFDENEHDAFRGYEDAFGMATRAVINANNAGLVTTLSVCVTKSFINAENIAAYMDLAKDLGVAFVQILEPRATGRYAGTDVKLGPGEILLLEEAYKKYNSHPAYADYPIINYLGYFQRKLGCLGAGSRFFYIDTDGDAHVCPFCARKVASALKFSAEDIVSLLGQHSCHVFDQHPH
jgi:MoaA/NifB/PqqE/SkfB family radical SAM enzyme